MKIHIKYINRLHIIRIVNIFRLICSKFQNFSIRFCHMFNASFVLGKPSISTSVTHDVSRIITRLFLAKIRNGNLKPKRSDDDVIVVNIIF